MFKLIRIVVLLTVLLVVAFSTLLDHSRVNDWKRPLYVSIYPVLAAGNNNQQSLRFVQQLKPRTFKPVEQYFTRELKRYGKNVARPVIINLHAAIQSPPPGLENGASRLSIGIWSLKTRYWAWRAAGSVGGVPGDVRIFVSYHPAGKKDLLERSTALRKGLIGLVNARASRSSNAKNNIIIAHELLHTLGASDKYNLSNGQPLAPEGLADPQRKPLYPQKTAEIMAARIPLSSNRWRSPANIGQTIVGPQTAAEVGFLDD